MGVGNLTLHRSEKSNRMPFPNGFREASYKTLERFLLRLWSFDSFAALYGVDHRHPGL